MRKTSIDAEALDYTYRENALSATGDGPTYQRITAKPRMWFFCHILALLLIPVMSGTLMVRGQMSTGQIVDVCEHGAVCDGVTDDTAAIQTVLSRSQKIRIPSGKTVLSGPINVPSNRTIQVDGAMKLKAATYAPLTGLLQGHEVSNITVSGKGTLDGNHQSGGTSAIFFDNASNISTSDLRIVSAGNGIMCYACTNFTARRHLVTDTFANAIKCETFNGDSRGCYIEDNQIETTSQQDGIFLWNDHGYTFTDFKVCGNKVHNVTDVGIEISVGVVGGTLCNNRVTSDVARGNTAYYLRSASHVTSIGNYGRGTTDGWVVQSNGESQATDITSTGDVMEYMTRAGFKVSKGVRITVTRATSQANGVGFNISQSSDVKLVDTIAHHNKLDGAAIEDTDTLEIVGGQYYDNVQQPGAGADISAIRLARNTGNGVRNARIRNVQVWDDQPSRTQNYCLSLEGTNAVSAEDTSCRTSKSGQAVYKTGNNSNNELPAGW
ncbi:glycoside hydrolase family 55 protein [Terriglobus albidus]|uniref:glycoside hydrolase family 55 protein n=1 Tax=Terriglobus albidus TaxID=1592106 RepID=UPI0021E0A116|nr:glycoside hydrolase family 55 protein [Terriglobus albidus]